MSSKMEALTIQEDVKENEVEDEEGLTLYPYERLITGSTDPAPDIDVTKREVLFSKMLCPRKRELFSIVKITKTLFFCRHTCLQLSSGRNLE